MFFIVKSDLTNLSHHQECKVPVSHWHPFNASWNDIEVSCKAICDLVSLKSIFLFDRFKPANEVKQKPFHHSTAAQGTVFLAVFKRSWVHTSSSFKVVFYTCPELVSPYKLIWASRSHKITQRGLKSSESFWAQLYHPSLMQMCS